MEARQRAVADQTEPRPVWPGSDAKSPSVCPRQRRRSPRTSAGRINPPVGCVSRPGRRQKPFAASAIAPGPFRGWGRNPLACIPHKGSRCSAGGHRHRIPWTASGLLAPRSRRAKASGDCSWPGRAPRSTEPRQTRFDGAMTFSPCRRGGSCRTQHRCRRGRALGSPAGAGRLPRRRQQPAWQRGRGRQARLGRRRRLGWMRRACLPQLLRSAACPCSPGSALQDQNAPLLPLRWRIGAPHCGQPARRQLEVERGAAVLLHELGDPAGLLDDEGVQRHLAGLDHVQRLLPTPPSCRGRRWPPAPRRSA